jgi:hypothetical protein
MEKAKAEVIEAFDIGGDDWEQQAELYSLNEITKEEYEILNRYI